MPNREPAQCDSMPTYNLIFTLEERPTNEDQRLVLSVFRHPPADPADRE
jgi:hypothetical protein